MKISQNGINLIKQFEGCKLIAYKCPAGVWTIGYGHTKGVVRGQKISPERAEKFLKEDIEQFEKGVNRHVSVPLNQNQFDALVSFTYNCGLGALQRSTLLKKLNAGDYAGAANEFPKWNKSNGKVLNGLVRRRAAERALFVKSCGIYHVVRKGETLSGIAKKYGMHYPTIAKLNGLRDPNKIYPGQKLKIK